MIHISHQYTFTVISHARNLNDTNLEEVYAFISQVGAHVLSKDELSPSKAVDIHVRAENADCIPGQLKEYLSQDKGYDLIFQKRDTRQDKKLFVFDMDSTLIYQEVIELIAAYANIEHLVAEITERAMNGELDFNASLKERVALLKGIDATKIWDELKHKISITKGAHDLTKALKKLGVVMAVCSGGFIPLAEYVKQQLGLDYAYANQLSTDANGCLDGTTYGMIVNGDKKAELLLEIASKHNIEPSKAVAVGDGANDLNMMAAAGFGVAWNAKPKVQRLAPCCLNSDSLQDILYIMGYNDDQIQELLV